MTFFFGGDFFILTSLLTLNFVFSIFFMTNNYSIIHIIMLLEITLVGTAVLLPSTASLLTNFVDGELFALFSIAIAAAESALALSFYLFLKYQRTPVKLVPLHLQLLDNRNNRIYPW
jgi:NADH:ubiquinone oxidoreductase subunit K